jgi:hypothetical protein
VKDPKTDDVINGGSVQYHVWFWFTAGVYDDLLVRRDVSDIEKGTPADWIVVE